MQQFLLLRAEDDETPRTSLTQSSLVKSYVLCVRRINKSINFGVVSFIFPHHWTPF